jgi:hypothetical protein
MKKSAKLGHMKTTQRRESLCAFCGKTTDYLELHYPYTKPNGVTGYRVFRGFAHVECLEKEG